MQLLTDCVCVRAVEAPAIPPFTFGEKFVKQQLSTPLPSSGFALLLVLFF